MTTEVTAPPTTERRPTRPRATGPQPATTLTVPAKPAAVTGANLAAIVGTAVAATGPVGVAVATVAAAGGAGGYAAYRAVARRRARNNTAAPYAAVGGTGRSGGAPRLGRAGSASPGGRAGGARPSPSPRGGAGRSGGGASTLGKGGRLGALFGGRKGGGAAAGGAGRSATGRTGGSAGHRRAGSTPGSGSRGPLTAGKVAAARRKIAARREPGPRLSDAVRKATARTDGKRPTAGQAWRAARHAITGDNPKKRGTLRRAAAGLVAGAVAADKAQREQWKARKRAEAARKAKNDRVATPKAQPSTPPRQTGGTVRRPATSAPHEQKRQPTPTPRPGSTISNERNPVMNSQGQSTPQPTSQFWQSARQLLANAVQFKPKGMIEVRTEAYEMPHSLAEIAQAIRARAQECTKQPLHPNLAAALMQIAATVESASQASRTLGPAFDALHPTEVTRILKPRVNEAAWDTTNNR